MFFGLDGVEIGIIIVFVTLFGAILSGFPVAFAIGGAGVIAFAIIAILDGQGLLIHEAIDTSSQAFKNVVASGFKPEAISVFTHPELPRAAYPVFPQGWEVALDRNISFVVNRMNERVFAQTLYFDVLIYSFLQLYLRNSLVYCDQKVFE